MAKPGPSVPDPTRFAQRVEELRQTLVDADPYLLADRTGTVYSDEGESRGVFHLTLWGQDIQISYPGFSCWDTKSREALPLFNQAMLMYYFTTADGVPLTGQWISFAELPDGRFYNQAFQGYSGRALAQHFQNDRVGFQAASIKLDGAPYPIGDAAYIFRALPRVSLLAVIWLGDEEFPSTCQVLFDAAASHYLPTDAYAILGSTLTRRLIAAARG